MGSTGGGGISTVDWEVVGRTRGVGLPKELARLRALGSKSTDMDSSLAVLFPGGLREGDRLFSRARLVL